MLDFFDRSGPDAGCGRSEYGFTAIAQAADVLVDFTHDVQLHPFADMTVIGTHEQSVFNQTAKLRTLLVHDTEYLVFKEEVRIGGIFHIRGDSDIVHIWMVWMIITVAVWVGSSGPAPLAGLGRKSHTGFYFRHGFVFIFKRPCHFRLFRFSIR